MTGPHSTNSGRPIGCPIAPGTERAKAVATGESGDLRATKDVVSSPAPRRLSRCQLDNIATSLTDRDKRTIELVDKLRFSVTTTLNTLVNADSDGAPASERSMRRRLSRLTNLGLLTPLPRRVGGMQSGSAGLVVHLTNAGDRLVRKWQGRDRRRRYSEPSTRFVQHCLDIGEALGRLTTELPAYGLTVDHWETEPVSWRRYQRGTSIATLKPDGYVEVRQENDTWGYFIEVDRGSESIPTVVRQIGVYEAYRRTGTEQERYGSFPPVIVTLYPGSRTTPAIRAGQLSEAVANTRQLPEQLAHVTDASGLSATVARLSGQPPEGRP